MKRRSVMNTFAAACLVAGVAVCPAIHAAEMKAPPVAPSVDQLVRERLHVTQYTLQRLVTPANTGEVASVGVSLGGLNAVLSLEPHSVRSEAFVVLVQGADGELRTHPEPPVATYRGEAANDPGSRVRASIVNGGLEATVVLSDGTEWGVQPLSQIFPGADPAMHVVYDVRSVSGPNNVRCGVPDPAPGVSLRPMEHAAGAPRGGVNRICEIACDADFEYYQSWGSSVPNVVNDIESLLNAVESIYEINTGVTFEITTIVVRTTAADPYTSTNPNTRLNEFGAWWAANASQIRRDIAHLFTGVNIDGGVIGIASLSSVCSTNGYGMSQSRYTTNVTLRRSLTAHEIGHNFSAQHCDGSGNCNIMCSCNGCGPPSCTGNFTSFGPTEVAQIEPFADGRTCLVNQPSTITPPFFDTFPTTTITTANWIYNDGCVINNLASNGPSTPLALELDAINANEWTDDEIRTHFINLVGVTTPVLSFWVRAVGVPAGGALVVETWQSTLRWVERYRNTSDGVDDPVYVQVTLNLSGAEIHNEFRVKFRVEVAAGTQNWYLDDVYVGAPVIVNGSCCQANGSCTETTQANCTGTWTSGAVCNPNPCPPPPIPGSCCFANGSCTEVASGDDCTGGFYAENGNCSPNICPQPGGACCMGSSCVAVASSANCTGANTSFAGAGTTCTPFSVTTPCCRADFNHNGAISSQDIFDFLAAFFSSTPAIQAQADFNNSGGVSSQDIFDFLAAFFRPGGCAP